jgi:hypothetical protein
MKKKLQQKRLSEIQTASFAVKHIIGTEMYQYPLHLINFTL